MKKWEAEIPLIRPVLAVCNWGNSKNQRKNDKAKRNIFLRFFFIVNPTTINIGKSTVK